jgi:hypothetical protein
MSGKFTISERKMTSRNDIEVVSKPQIAPNSKARADEKAKHTR